MSCGFRDRSCRRDCLHRALIDSYHDARDARDALRESGLTAPASATFGSSASYAQLEDDDFDAVVPPLLFKDWLIDAAKPRE